MSQEIFEWDSVKLVLPKDNEKEIWDRVKKVIDILLDIPQTSES